MGKVILPRNHGDLNSSNVIMRELDNGHFRLLHGPFCAVIGVGGGGGGGGAGGHCAPPPPNFRKPKIRAKAVGNLGKSNGKFGKKQWEIRAKAIIFARNICRHFPSFLVACAQIFPLLLSEFPIAFSRNSGPAIGNSGKSNGQIWAKAMRKLGKRWDIISGKHYGSLG